MKQDTISAKIFAIALIGGACLLASLSVLGLAAERQERFAEARQEIADKWSKRQVIVGPMIIVDNSSLDDDTDTYVLPENLRYETVLEPEIRSRGIFNSVVYTSKIKVSGDFSSADLGRAMAYRPTATFAVAITDTRGIEKKFDLKWNGNIYAFEPGPGKAFLNSSGLHAVIPVNFSSKSIPFSFEIQLKGSEGISIAPVGKETIINISSSWPSPSFVGAFLPGDREVTESGFKSEWRISSFGRSYPQIWQGDAVGLEQVLNSSAGVDLREQIDAYDMTFRSVKYAILFIVITFAAFFLFDVLANVRVHPVQYLLIGSALSLFYLLLLSLSEQIGFLAAYIVATAMIAILVTMYSAYVLKNNRRALPIFILLVTLYGYLYFVLRLEDYALLFGSFLLFALLAVAMYMTRNIDWFALGKATDRP
jgi:inner membrane protein